MSLGFLLLQRERQEHEIERLAMTDELTGVFNRRSLFDLGDKEVARARRTGASLSALLLDLDHFKRVNDKYGHLGGDAVLVRFVEVVRGCLRSSDILARYGGEEFLVLLPDVGSAGAKVVGERIRATIEASTFFIGAVPLKITASVGVAAFVSAGDPTLTALVARSDAALYIAKRDGRNRVAMAKAA
jgi:diguanylate cyclase (GGDEF)-like protein